MKLFSFKHFYFFECSKKFNSKTIQEKRQKSYQAYSDSMRGTKDKTVIARPYVKNNFSNIIEN